MKYIIAILAIISLGGFGLYIYLNQSNGVGGGLGTIEQLSQWRNDGTYITQNTIGTILKLTGYESSGDCLVTNSSGVVSTSSCGGGGSSKWTDGGSVIYPTGGESVAVSSISATGTATSTFTRLSVSTALNLFGTIGSALSDFCVAITGGSGLCDGTDATGGGGGGSISTSTTPVGGQLAFWTSNSALSSVATGTLTEAVNGLQFDQTRGLVGGSAVLSLTSGFAIPSTTDYTGWNLASSSRHSAVTLSGALDYITLVGQDIVRGAIDLATDITGTLLVGNGGTGLTSTSTFLFENEIDTESELESFLTDVTNVFTNNDGALADDNLTNNSIEDLNDVGAMTENTGDLLTWNGSAWTDTATSALGYSWNNLINIPAGFADNVDDTGGGSSSATSTMIVCASGCTYSSIQDALNAGFTNIELKAETYAGPVSITASDTKIKGAGLYSSLITCASTASTACVKVATSSNLTRITLEHFGVDNTLGTTLGIGLDTSNTSNVYVTNVRITDFNLGHFHQDTNNQSFYSSFNNMVYFDNNNCFATAGTKSNDNTISNARCRVATSTGIGYKLVDAEGWLLSSVNSEPGSVIGTGLYIDGTSISNTIINPWFEANATGTEILAGALNTSIKGGRITAGTIGVSDAGTRTFLDSTLVSANTTDFTAGSTGITMINGRSAYSAPSMLIGTTTPGSTYERLVLGLSTSEATANALVINNYGAFATAPSAILFNNTTGGFSGVARIFANPGSGYTNSNLNFAVSDSAKALQTRMTIDVDGDVGIGTTTPIARLSVIGASSGTILQLFSNAGTKFMEMLNTGVTTLLGAWDFGGADSVEIPNGTGPTANATGEIAFDTTDNQIIIATSTTALAIPTINKLWGATIASTSVDFASGGRIPLPPHRDGIVITEVHCFVDGGTSKVINIDTMAGGAQLDSLTCATTLTSDTAQSANSSLSAGALMALEFGATTGSVDYVTFSAWGYVKAE